jgi:hypothetical protein
VMFFLVWDKDSYIGSFFVLFPYMYVLQHELVHLLQSSSVGSGLMPMRTGHKQSKMQLIAFTCRPR